MKKIILIGALVGVGTFTAHSQRITAMAEQLVELKLLEQNTGDGYKLVSGSLDSVSQITGGEYRLHFIYFQSLLKYSYYDQTIYPTQPAGNDRYFQPRAIHH